MKAIAVILFLMAIWDIACTSKAIKKNNIRLKKIVKHEKFYSVSIQIYGDLLLIIFLVMWWRV